jgi:uncharacterized membrane protein YozB (DUF420 family)
MNAHLSFWTAALANLGAVALVAVLGVRRAKAGDYAAHRRMMKLSVAGVVLFLVAYLVKVPALGREDRSVWGARSLFALYIHETCVLAMLVAGGIALWRARRFGPDLARFDPRDAAVVANRKQHGRAGGIALVAALAGFATAAVVLAGMYQRAGS